VFVKVSSVIFSRTAIRWKSSRFMWTDRWTDGQICRRTDRHEGATHNRSFSQITLRRHLQTEEPTDKFYAQYPLISIDSRYIKFPKYNLIFSDHSHDCKKCVSFLSVSVQNITCLTILLISYRHQTKGCIQTSSDHHFGDLLFYRCRIFFEYLHIKRASVTSTALVISAAMLVLLIIGI
jgi:hypothetical protein